MPTVIRIGAFRFFFYSNEGNEPPHIHIRSGDGEAKFWLDPIDYVWSVGYNSRQLNQIEQHIEDNLSDLLAAWHDYFGD